MDASRLNEIEAKKPALNIPAPTWADVEYLLGIVRVAKAMLESDMVKEQGGAITVRVSHEYLDALHAAFDEGKERPKSCVGIHDLCIGWWIEPMHPFCEKVCGPDSICKKCGHPMSAHPGLPGEFECPEMPR